MADVTPFTPFHRGGSGASMVLIHGFMDTWRTWELVLPQLELAHDVLAVTLPGHAGGPPLSADVTDATMADAVGRAMDRAGMATAHLVGNSLGGFTALQLAARGRADSVVALAPAGGWADGMQFEAALFDEQLRLHALTRAGAANAGSLVATAEGRRRATRLIVEHADHIPAELIAHIIVGIARCDAAPLVAAARTAAWTLDAAAIDCPVRIVWGLRDQLLPWPAAAERFTRSWLPTADYVELDDVGHCPQLDVPLETAALITGFTAS